MSKRGITVFIILSKRNRMNLFISQNVEKFFLRTYIVWDTTNTGWCEDVVVNDSSCQVRSMLLHYVKHIKVYCSVSRVLITQRVRTAEQHLDITSSCSSMCCCTCAGCESFIRVPYTSDFRPRVKYLENYMSNMVPLNFVQDIFTSLRFMAGRYKGHREGRFTKIQGGRGRNCAQGLRRSEGSREGWMEGGRGRRRRRKNYEWKGGCFQTPLTVKAGVCVKAAL